MTFYFENFEKECKMKTKPKIFDNEKEVMNTKRIWKGKMNVVRKNEKRKEEEDRLEVFKAWGKCNEYEKIEKINEQREEEVIKEKKKGRRRQNKGV